MPLATLTTPFDHPDWLFEVRWDGFRGLAYIEDGAASLVSRNVYKSFGELCQELAKSLRVRDAVIDGEIVHLGPDSRPPFYDLLHRRPRNISWPSTCSGWTGVM